MEWDQLHYLQRQPFADDELPALINGTEPLVAHPTGNEKCPIGVDHKITLAVGSEGGFIDYEVEKFRSIGFKVINVGERILRVETAVPVILSKMIGDRNGF